MAGLNKVLYAIDNDTAPQEFERLCVDMLFREGYRHIVPGGRTNDLGRDAELRFWSGASANFNSIIFQFSLEERWERKLQSDAAKVAAQSSGVVSMVFVTSRHVTVAKRDQLKKEFRESKGWHLEILDREWLRSRLEQRDQDLAKKYFGLDLPASLNNFGLLVELSDFNCKAVEQLFEHTSPESIRASLIESTRREPASSDNWKQLADLEYYLRNYDSALNAVNRSLQLEKSDPVAQLNLRLFKGAILAEYGVAKNSRPLLIEARDILSWAVERVKRPIDHYNYANVLSALGEFAESEKQYKICLDREPCSAQGWTNFANLLLQLGRAEEAMHCFEKALIVQPNLIEAHLSKARAYLVHLNDPKQSVACFETAMSLMHGPDRAGRYIRYWYAQSLAAAGRPADALLEVDRELIEKPGDKYLLKLKTDVLARLWRQDAQYELIALEFLRFRTRAFRNDYFGLCDLIHLCAKRELEDEAWDAMQANVSYGGFNIKTVASTTGISLMDFATGFANIRLYAQFRKTHALEHRFIEHSEQGLSENLAAVSCLDQALVAPFGILAQRVRVFAKGDKSVDLKSAFAEATKIESRLIAYFGPNWLARKQPPERKEQIDKLSVGMLLGFEILVAEMSRQFGYLGGRFGLSKEQIEASEKCEWREVQTDFAVHLMERVMTEWKMMKVPSQQLHS